MVCCTENLENSQLQDLLYRTNKLTTDSGSVHESYDCDAYGRTLMFNITGQPITTSLCDFIFTGRRFDSETGLYYYRARYYSPELGRFISKDPLNYIDSMGLYEYVNSSPLVYLDFLGTKISWKNVLIGIGAIAIGVALVGMGVAIAAPLVIPIALALKAGLYVGIGATTAAAGLVPLIEGLQGSDKSYPTSLTGWLGEAIDEGCGTTTGAAIGDLITTLATPPNPQSSLENIHFALSVINNAKEICCDGSNGVEMGDRSNPIWEQPKPQLEIDGTLITEKLERYWHMEVYNETIYLMIYQILHKSEKDKAIEIGLPDIEHEPMPLFFPPL